MNKNKLYYHFYIPNAPSHWELLLYEQLDCIEGSLLHHHCEIEICVSSNQENYQKLKKNIKSYSFLKFTWFDTSIEENKNHYEGTTFSKLYDECDNYDNIAYIHNKGITNLTKYTNKWRKILEYAIIEKYQNNLDALKNGYDISGIFWMSKDFYFCGNFWWAKSSYIKSLPKPTIEKWDLFNEENTFISRKHHYMLWSKRHKYELWIGSNNPKANDISILKSIPIGSSLYSYDLNIKRQTILNFKSEEKLNYY
jgi:hypothetical protein